MDSTGDLVYNSQYQRKGGEDRMQKTGRLNQDLYFALQTYVTVSVALILIFMLLGRLTPVDGSSMEPTLHDRELMLVQTIGYTPRQGDVVIFRKDFRDDIHAPLVKRIIAVGGQTVDVDYASGAVLVDGVPLEEPYILEPMEAGLNPYLTNHHVVVPEGSVFVMGDNRNHSDDSRDIRLGTVDQRCILGCARWILFPFQQFGPIGR